MNVVELKPRSLYYGTPVALITTRNADGSENLTPMSSSWSLRNRIVLGIGAASQAVENLRRCPELAVGLPDAPLWQRVEALSSLTGSRHVPQHKAAQFRYEPDKWQAAGLTRVDSRHIGPGRIAECPLQMEAVAEQLVTVDDEPEGFVVVIARVDALYAHESIVNADGNAVDPQRWSPLIFSFGAYHRVAPELGRMSRAVRR
ncbi:flavin reductase family protein [Burkholderia alba]|uniref:flavin reductase family protein n=1 Tax=Burkholderia alba TaxID=2683677 RepID=UPI002B052F72|nr:flavin reductase family protein [Burkholderia alba]